MSNNFQGLMDALKSTPYKVFRDKAPKKTKFPYIVYTFVEQGKKSASSKIFRRLPQYQISLFTVGTEKDLQPIEEALEAAGIPYGDFRAQQGDENDDTITNFYSLVRVVGDG